MIDVSFLIMCKVCYPNSRLEELFPVARTLKEVLTLKDGPWSKVPLKDRLWVATRPEVLSGEVMREWLARMVERLLKLIENPDPTVIELPTMLREDRKCDVNIKPDSIIHSALWEAANYKDDPDYIAPGTYRIAYTVAIAYASQLIMDRDRTFISGCEFERQNQIKDLLELIND